MAVKYEPIVAEDLNIGRGTVSVSMPGGGTAIGTRLGLRSLNDGGGLYADLPLPSTVKGTVDVVTDSSTKTPGASISGGGTYCVLAFSNGTDWLVVMG